MSLSHQQNLLLETLQEAIEDGTIDLTLGEIAAKMEEKAKPSNSYEEKYISKLISSLKKIFGEREIIKSYYFKGQKKFFLRGDLIVTRRETAGMLLELRKAAILTGKTSRSEFIKNARNNELLAKMSEEEINDRLTWAEKPTVNYIKQLSEDVIAPAERILNELGYLFSITDK